MKFHWVITLQEQQRNGDVQLDTQHGTYTPRPGETRKDVYAKIHGHVVAQTGMSSPAVLFFSLEPNELGASS